MPVISDGLVEERVYPPVFGSRVRKVLKRKNWFGEKSARVWKMMKTKYIGAKKIPKTKSRNAGRFGLGVEGGDLRSGAEDPRMNVMTFRP